MSPTTARYEVFPSRDGHRWRLVAANGQTVAQSEGYRTPGDAERGALDAHATAMAAITSLTIASPVEGATVQSQVAVIHVDQ